MTERKRPSTDFIAGDKRRVAGEGEHEIDKSRHRSEGGVEDPEDAEGRTTRHEE